LRGIVGSAIVLNSIFKYYLLTELKTGIKRFREIFAELNGYSASVTAHLF
jgi:hypothetical protein